MRDELSRTQMVFVVVCIVAGAYWLWPTTESWTGVFYPDRSNLTIHEIVGEFESLESCRNFIIRKIDTLEEPNLSDWECGLNCKPFDGDPEMLLCAKTER